MAFLLGPSLQSEKRKKNPKTELEVWYEGRTYQEAVGIQAFGLWEPG